MACGFRRPVEALIPGVQGRILANLFTLVADHVASRAVRALSRAREAVLQELGALADTMDPSPVSVVVFGSFVRGEADAANDLDIVMVRLAGVGEDAEPWVSSAESWRTAARRFTGNPVQVLEVDETEAARRPRRPTSLWADVLRDGIAVHGSPLPDVRGRRSA